MTKLMKNEKGFSLLEVLFALGLMGIIAVAFLTGIASSSRAVLLADERTMAESLARSQMEYVKEQPYDFLGDYDPAEIPQEYVDAGYSVTIDFEVAKAGLQKITVTVSRYGEVVITLEDYKANR